MSHNLICMRILIGNVFFSVCREELMDRGVNNIDEAMQKEFPSWFKKHVRHLNNVSEDLKLLADGPDRRVVVHSGCNVKGARFRTVTREKNLKTQNSGVMTKASFGDEEESEFYGVLQEVLELQYGSNKHGDRSVYLFRCDWFDLASRNSKMKDDGYFKSVNTSTLWYKDSPFILASQAETCFYLDDTKFDNPWKVVQTFSHRHVYDVPEKESGDDDAYVGNEDAYQDEMGSSDHIFINVEGEDQDVELEDEDADRSDDVELVDARTMRRLEEEDETDYVDMSEDEEDTLAENRRDDGDINSDNDSDV